MRRFSSENISVAVEIGIGFGVGNVVGVRVFGVTSEA
jgi:hypothetical protein